MPSFIIRTINSAIHAEGCVDQPFAEDAYAQAVAGALMIAGEEIHRGAPTSAVELTVETVSGEILLRSALNISVAPLATTRAPTTPLPVPTNDQ